MDYLFPSLDELERNGSSVYSPGLVAGPYQWRSQAPTYRLGP